MALSLRPSLASIAPNMAFLDVLASWWLKRQGFPAGDPLLVAEGIFIVPTRRAARGLSEAFLRASGGAALLLPRILPLGGVEEAPLALSGALDLPPAVPVAQRLAVLTRFILAMDGANGAPTELDRAWALAQELASLLDEAALAGVDLARALPNAVGADFAAHWNVTLRFLEVITHQWPVWLDAAGYCDVAERQIRLLEAQRAAWEQAPPGVPVIAAGSTGAIPAVAALLKLVAHLPQGLVVLPGLDLALDEASWDALDASHPQASLRALLVARNSPGAPRRSARRGGSMRGGWPCCRPPRWGFGSRRLNSTVASWSCWSRPINRRRRRRWRWCSARRWRNAGGARRW
jgi:ATP-dependent helicase/nuclease subunit B